MKHGRRTVKVRRKRRWVQLAMKHHKPGSLHRYMGVRKGTVIPLVKLEERKVRLTNMIPFCPEGSRERAKNVKYLRQVNFAIVKRGFKHHKGRRK